MNICILFILFNGTAYITPQCISLTGVMHAPRDVVYLEQLPLHYSSIVFESPRFYLYNHFDNVRHIHNWRNYRKPRVHHHHVQRHMHHVRRTHKRHHVKQHKRHYKQRRQHKQFKQHKRHKQLKQYKQRRQHKQYRRHKNNRSKRKHM
jgi:hypothetical protein